jgi:beta-glucanase (GH16 family)
MRCTLSSRSLFCAAVILAGVILLAAGRPAHAGTWGAPQTINSWNKVNGRWTANNELETYTSSCVWYEGSTLVIKTYKSGSVYYSGRVESLGLYHYGSYTFVANLPSGDGLLPAVWSAYLSPWLPEIDAAEVVGSQPNNVYQSFHDWSNNTTTLTRPNPGGWSNNYHTYSFTWWPDHIDFWVDGSYTGTKWYTTGSAGLHFIVDTAVGGNWPGNPDNSTWATPDGARYLKVSSITYTPYTP